MLVQRMVTQREEMEKATNVSQPDLERDTSKNISRLTLYYTCQVELLRTSTSGCIISSSAIVTHAGNSNKKGE